MESPVLDSTDVVGSQSDAALIHYPGFVFILQIFSNFVLCNACISGIMTQRFLKALCFEHLIAYYANGECDTMRSF